MISQPPILKGRTVRLEPLSREHVEGLYAIATASPTIFRYTSTPVTPEERETYFAKVFDDQAAGRALPFAMVDAGNDRLIGTTRLTDLELTLRNCELGYTWFEPAYFGGAVNVESKLLLLTYVFETLDLLRVQLNTDARNEHSQAAILALGAQYEGRLRAHKVVKGGHIRDTLVYSIIYSDWPTVKPRLQERLAAKLERSGE